MDQLTENCIDKKVRAFIASIDRSAVCELASSYHPKKRQCWLFSEPQRGSYNICFPVVFTDLVESDRDLKAEPDGERWMVRIPLLPRLAFPEEKLRGEIATMKYISEKTTIPIPRLHGYSICQHTNILGLPFMLLEYIEGRALNGADMLVAERSLQQHLYEQLSDIYLQLSRQQFDRVGALTLDETGESWVFRNSRPLTVELNDQELSGMESSRIVGTHQTYTSTVDYAYATLRLVSNDFYRRRDSVFDEEDARHYLYSLFASPGLIMEWADPQYNHGPFILMHGDFRPPNIFVDEDLNIVSVMDWEWSHTVPAQMFVTPSWITGHELSVATETPARVLHFVSSTQQFNQAMQRREARFYNADEQPTSDLLLTKLWRKELKASRMFIAHALLQPGYFSNVYWHVLDRDYYGENSAGRVQSFFKVGKRKPLLKAVQEKMEDLESLHAELTAQGLEPRKPLPDPTPEENRTLKDKLQSWQNSCGSGAHDMTTEGVIQAQTQLNMAQVIPSTPCQLCWCLLGISASVCYVIAKL